MKFQRTEKTSPLVEKYRAASDEHAGPATQVESKQGEQGLSYSCLVPPSRELRAHQLSRFVLALGDSGGGTGTSLAGRAELTAEEVPFDHDQRRDELEIRDSLTDERF